MQGSWVQSLVKELRTLTLHSVAKINNLIKLNKFLKDFDLLVCDWPAVSQRWPQGLPYELRWKWTSGGQMRGSQCWVCTRTLAPSVGLMKGNAWGWVPGVWMNKLIRSFTCTTGRGYKWVRHSPHSQVTDRHGVLPSSASWALKYRNPGRGEPRPHLEQSLGCLIILNIFVNACFPFMQSCPEVSKQDGVPHHRLHIIVKTFCDQVSYVFLDLTTQDHFRTQTPTTRVKTCQKKSIG